MTRASLVVDFQHVRCGNCKAALRDELSKVCPLCGAIFDSIASNHVGLAARLEKRRAASGVSECHARLKQDDEAEPVELVGA